MNLKNILLPLMLFVAISCSKKSPDSLVVLSCEQTQCADPWQYGSTDAETISKISTYLRTNNYGFTSVDIRSVNSGAVCLACTCPTGKVIYVTVTDTGNIRTRYAALNFR
jgi:hypothetical protein